MHLISLDHLVLTVSSLEATCAWYEKVLGMRTITFAGGRKALRFGNQKINLHERGREYEPRADIATVGSGDLCFLTDVPMDSIVAHLNDCEVDIIEGPDQRSGAVSAIMSVYIRDPDGNLIEVSNSIDP